MATKTLQENIEQAISDFLDIKQAIIGKGVSVSDGTPTRDYAGLISGMPMGDSDIEDGIIDRTLTSYSNSRITQVGAYAFCYFDSLKEISLPNVTEMGHYVLWRCVNLTSLNFPKLTKLPISALRACLKLSSVYSPKLTLIRTEALGDCYSLKKVIITQTDSVCTLENINAFENCSHIHGISHSTYNPNGLKDGFIFVPPSLVDNYRSATNWSTISSQIVSNEYAEMTANYSKISGETGVLSDSNGYYHADGTLNIGIGAVGIEVFGNNSGDSFTYNEETGILSYDLISAESGTSVTAEIHYFI